MELVKSIITHIPIKGIGKKSLELKESLIPHIPNPNFVNAGAASFFYFKKWVFCDESRRTSGTRMLNRIHNAICREDPPINTLQLPNLSEMNDISNFIFNSTNN